MNSFLTEYSLSSLYKMDSGISSSPEQAGHGYPFISFSTIFNNIILPETIVDLMDTSEKERQIYSIKCGDILITRTSETIDELAMSSVALKDYPGATFSGFAKRLRPISSLTYPKFMAFLLRSTYFRKIVNYKAIMTLRASFNEEIFSYIKVLLPSYDDQVKIGDFCFDIYSKKIINGKIIEALEEYGEEIYDFLLSNPNLCETKKVGDLVEITTGKEFANFGGKQGKYRFFSCSKDVLWCDQFAFDADSVIVSTHGDFHADHVRGKFNAYTCDSVLTPFDSLERGIIYFAIKKYLPVLQKGSNGSIIKFIGKKEIMNIPVLIPNNKKLAIELNNIICKIENKIIENKKANEQIDYFFPLLLNGQLKLK